MVLSNVPTEEREIKAPLCQVSLSLVVPRDAIDEQINKGRGRSEELFPVQSLHSHTENKLPGLEIKNIDKYP